MHCYHFSSIFVYNYLFLHIFTLKSDPNGKPTWYHISTSKPKDKTFLKVWEISSSKLTLLSCVVIMNY